MTRKTKEKILLKFFFGVKIDPVVSQFLHGNPTDLDELLHEKFRYIGFYRDQREYTLDEIREMEKSLFQKLDKLDPAKHPMHIISEVFVS